MDFNGTITFSATPELLSVLNRLIDAFTAPKDAETKTATQGAPTRPTAPKSQTVVPDIDEPVTEKPPQAKPAASPVISLEAFREAVGNKSRNGKKDEVKALLAQLGYANVTSVPEEKRQEIMAAIEGI